MAAFASWLKSKKSDASGGGGGGATPEQLKRLQATAMCIASKAKTHTDANVAAFLSESSENVNNRVSLDQPGDAETVTMAVAMTMNPERIPTPAVAHALVRVDPEFKTTAQLVKACYAETA